jgi:hypothetical protein
MLATGIGLLRKTMSKDLGVLIASGGFKYKPHHDWTLKYEFHDKTGHFGLRYSQNKKTSESSEWRKEMGENWQAQAISVTYEF